MPTAWAGVPPAAIVAPAPASPVSWAEHAAQSGRPVGELVAAGAVEHEAQVVVMTSLWHKARARAQAQLADPRPDHT